MILVRFLLDNVIFFYFLLCTIMIEAFLCHRQRISCVFFFFKIDLQFKAGNITGDETINLLEQLNTAIFDSSGISSNSYDPYSCNLNGLSTYINCPYGEKITSLHLHPPLKKQLSTKHQHHEYHYDHNKHHDHDHDHDTDIDIDVTYDSDIDTVTIPKIRGVTLLGAIVPSYWAGNNDGYLTYDENDMKDIYEYGLNTILIPVPTNHAFWISDQHKHDHHHHHDHYSRRSLREQHVPPKEKDTKTKEKDKDLKKKEPHKEPKGSGKKIGDNIASKDSRKKTIVSKDTKKQKMEPRDLNYLLDLIDMAKDTKLHVLLQFTGTSKVDDKVLEHVLDYSIMHYPNTVIGIQLPIISKDDIDVDYSNMISKVRKYSFHLPIFVPLNIGQLAHIKAKHSSDEHIYTAMSMDHTTSIADVASSSSLDDRMKIYYHENVACTQRSPIDYVSCYKNMPALVTSGFDLAVDNCAFQDDHTITFNDYGQCDRWDETIHSPWWNRHRQSFAVRQLASFEQGLGWIFAAWKVYDDDVSNSLGIVETPAQLHSFKAVSAAKLFPDLLSYVTGSNDLDDGIPACLNPPLDDFILGDETLSPVPAPTPDCGNGWWNYTIQDCSYWVPPPPPPPCPVCEVCDGDIAQNSTEDISSDVTVEETSETPTSGTYHHRHHSPLNTSMFIDNMELMREGMKSNINDNNSYGLNHIGFAFIAGMLLSLTTSALIYRYNRQRTYRQGYDIIPNE
jgi:hypothetical protein